MRAELGVQRERPAAGSDRLGLLADTLLRKRLRRQGFIVFDDYGPRWHFR